MTLYLTRLFELFFLPPGIFIVLLLLSIVFVNNLKRLKSLLVLQIFLIYILSIPVTNHYLFSTLEVFPALTIEQIENNKAEVIIVLAGGIKPLQREYHSPDISYFTQLRLRYGAWLQKKTGLPMLVAGGIEIKGITEAELMQQVLQNEYEINETILLEKQSQNSYENAIYSSKILAEQQFNQAYLVTNAFHMDRAVMAFKKQGINVTPAPMGFQNNSIGFVLRDFLPNSKSIWQNYLALHEIIGFYWYKVRY
ncbi:MAG: YdcF family protein [Gammaproteobacteria bacterium]|nr:YdcF family protein [Gammaproteobacteria bacterium]